MISMITAIKESFIAKILLLTIFCVDHVARFESFGGPKVVGMRKIFQSWKNLKYLRKFVEQKSLTLQSLGT